ncbi:MAG TPA: protein phosphatase CheZ [Acetobacteraceae bacterium]|nr:protein phosphatase CheZ [Acetobacteraceae bacterium]
MAEANLIDERLARLRVRYPDSDPGMVADVVRAVLASMSGDLSGKEAQLLAEVEALGRTVAAARAEIAALSVDDITGSHLPSATDELDAIVTHTAAATEAILACCERLDALKLDGEAARTVQDVTTRIYEACSFQDITGQRIRKVVSTLKTIEAKVASMVSQFGGAGGGATPETPPGDPDLALLNGPQLPAAAMAQADIDALLASFG